MSTVTVTGITSSTSHQALRDFFSFCGKIKTVDLREEADTKHAVITFESAQSVHTALMLDGGTLGGATFHVVAEEQQSRSQASHPELGEESQKHHDHAHHHIEQHDKPRAGIAAEYLAKGYQLSDHILRRAIEIDQNQGISKNFVSYIQNLDSKIGNRALGPDKTVSGKVQSTFCQARDRAKTIDEQKGFSKIAHEYYAKALASPAGQSVLSFYTSAAKQVFDIHAEAQRIVNQHKNQPVESPHSAPPVAAPADDRIKD